MVQNLKFETVLWPKALCFRESYVCRSLIVLLESLIYVGH